MTGRPPPDIVRGMESPDPLDCLPALLERVEALARSRRQQADELRSLRQQQENLLQERAMLIHRNEQARSRVEAMIARLKTLEEHT